MKELNKYFNVQKSIFDYFGYKEDWVKIPISDARDMFWFIVGDEKNGSVRYADTEEDLLDEDSGNYYESEIYTQRFLPKWVYRGKEYTMISVDTHTDGNKFLMVFDNARER